jgi:Zn finger protein HypA/HybF involved in hydrogenase expression
MIYLTIGLILGVLSTCVAYLVYRRYQDDTQPMFNFTPEKQHFTCDICENEFDTEILGDNVECPKCHRKISIFEDMN